MCQPRHYELSLTSVGLDPVHIPFQVNQYYYINTSMDSGYYRALAALLHTHGESFQRLVPSVFLAELDKHISGFPNLKPPPESQSDGELHINGTSTSRYFSHWRYNKLPRKPSAENRDKTLKLMGRPGLEHSISKNLSNVWKDPANKRRYKHL